MKSKWTSVIAYLSSKFAAAGAIFLGFLVVTGGSDLYETSEMIHELPL
ncbi:hypothetical protein ACFFSY_23800 [Paenibacillus aurantiacus]|uniref:Uncharacterized protein n=1 Tax=Paenibacillus aurantiacus TaxID=1936118 RepID=A0ABV5KUS0_9BACL